MRPGLVKLTKECVSGDPLTPANCLPQAGSSHHPNATHPVTPTPGSTLALMGQGVWGERAWCHELAEVAPNSASQWCSGPSMQTFLLDCDQSFFFFFLSLDKNAGFLSSWWSGGDHPRNRRATCLNPSSWKEAQEQKGMLTSNRRKLLGRALMDGPFPLSGECILLGFCLVTTKIWSDGH